MDRGLAQVPGRWRGPAIAVIALIVVACGSTNPESANPSTAPTAAPASATDNPTPSPSAPPSPSASPSPSANVGAALVDKLSGFSFFGKSTIGGELDVASARYGITGSYDVAGLANHTVLTIQTPTGTAQESIYVGGTTYHRTGIGPWYVKPPTLDASDVSSFLKTLKTIVDAGVESKNGQQLHHLTLPAGTSLPPAALGLTDPSISGAEGSIEFWAKDDGTPAVMTAKATWKQTVAGQPVDVGMTLEFTFSDVGAVFTIAAPDQVWTTYTSKLNHVTIGYPTDWDLFKAKKAGAFDEFDSADYAFTTIGRYSAKGFGLNTLVGAFRDHKPSYASKWKVDKISSTTMAGISARQLLVHATVKGVKQYWVVVVALKGGYFYELDIIDRAGHEADTNALAALFLGTVILK